jgi:signal transduction histidine kinase
VTVTDELARVGTSLSDRDSRQRGEEQTRERRTFALTPAISLAIWTVPTLLSTLETVTFASISGHPIPAWRAFVAEAPQWYAWALLTPLIIRLGQAAPLRRGVRWRHTVVHVAASLAMSGVTAFFAALVNAWVRPSGRGLLDSAGRWFLGDLPATTLAYVAILGASYALANYARLRERERHAAQLETQLRDATLAALRMQLQPHFLFNSLNAVAALVRDQDSAGAIRVVSLLSDVLRTTMNETNGHETRLASEIDFVRRYLDIERVRFGDRLRIDVDVPGPLADARVPVFILQPFVENALKHGVLRERAGNAISIRASMVDHTIRLAVRDDGRGLPDGRFTEGVGIRNARERLSRMYGDRAALNVANAPDGPGVLVDIVVPLRS